MSLRLIPSVHRVTHSIALYLDRKKAGVTQGEAHILAHLSASGDQTVGELHAALGHRRSTLTGILDRLQKRGAIERAVNAGDRRTYSIRLTPAGKKIAQDVSKLLADIEAHVLNETKGKHLKGFETVVDAMAAALAEPRRSRKNA
jgi:DNA-binding MarR family transcriptional regulator